MSDILSIATKRHEQLKAELRRIEQFLGVAAELAKLEAGEVDIGPPITVREPNHAEPEGKSPGDAARLGNRGAAPSADQNGRPSLFRRA